jgi:methanethiol S-methyltransferase
MKRAIAFAYGVASYAVFFATFLYLIGFLGDFLVPKTVNSGGATFGPVLATAVNVALLALFAVQHSVMARPGFKRVWTRVVAPSVERSTYVLISSATLIVLYWGWQPLTHVLWQADSSIGIGIGYGVFAAGLGLVLLSTFLIDHFELFGLKQVTMALLRRVPVPPAFQVRGLYRFVRHPLYVGWILTFWGTPTMTCGHLLLASSLTLYMLVAIRYEERDLIAVHGRDYARYRAQVPMLVPRPGMVHPSVAPAPHSGVAATH